MARNLKFWAEARKVIRIYRMTRRFGSAGGVHFYLVNTYRTWFRREPRRCLRIRRCAT